MRRMDVNQALPLLGGMTPAAFMTRHWQRRPLLVRQAWPGVVPPVDRAGVFALAARDDVESRFVARDGDAWQVRHGPMRRRSMPPLTRPGWTVLVQGLDLHVQAAHEMLTRFRFVPDARLDDLMISWASPGGGVGPHIDEYDVFLLQVQGRRRWRIGPVRTQAQAACVEGLPIKLLRHFVPEHEHVLEPGDMLYLPPRWGHEGVAEGGDSMSCSAGFRVPVADELARDLLQRLADDEDDECVRYRDPGQPATAAPATIPAALTDFARAALQRRLSQPLWLERSLGEVLSEPKPSVWFQPEGEPSASSGLCLDRRTRMMYDEHFIFINGEAFRATGRDAMLLRRLADERRLPAAHRRRLSRGAAALLADWQAAGWVHADGP
jgi:50S ribosomal protein L16 3-hydroxylase